jgi:putative restriction endonuclease
MERKPWSKDDLITAFNLYCQIPFGQIHNRNPKIIELSRILGRTPSALSWKLANFAGFDPELKKRGIKGAVNAGKLDREVWDEFNGDWAALAYRSEKLLAGLKGEAVEVSAGLPAEDIEEIAGLRGAEKARLVKVRVNQNFFRKTILADYDFSCCVTGIGSPELLVASHISPWAADVRNRLNPRNGLCLNALHDRAFDSGLLTITPDYRVRLSRALIAKNGMNPKFRELFGVYDGVRIRLPGRFLPDKEFLAGHNRGVFKG